MISECITLYTQRGLCRLGSQNSAKHKAAECHIAFSMQTRHFVFFIKREQFLCSKSTWLQWFVLERTHTAVCVNSTLIAEFSYNFKHSAAKWIIVFLIMPTRHTIERKKRRATAKSANKPLCVTLSSCCRVVCIIVLGLIYVVLGLKHLTFIFRTDPSILISVYFQLV